MSHRAHHRQSRRRNTAPNYRPSHRNNHTERLQSRFTRRPSVNSNSSEPRPAYRRNRGQISPTSPISDTAGIRQYQDRLHPAVIAAYRAIRSSAGRLRMELETLVASIEELAPGEDHMEWNFNPGTVVYMPAPRQPDQHFNAPSQEPHSNRFHTATAAHNETQNFQQNLQQQQHGNTVQNHPTPAATADRTFHPQIFATGPGYYPTGPPTTDPSAEELERLRRRQAWSVQYYPDPATTANSSNNQQQAQTSIPPGQTHIDPLRPANPNFNLNPIPNNNNTNTSDRMTLPHLINAQTLLPLPPQPAANTQDQSQTQIPQQAFTTTTTPPYQQQPHDQNTNTITTPGTTHQAQSQPRPASTNPFPTTYCGPANSDVWRWRSNGRTDGQDDDGDGEIM